MKFFVTCLTLALAGGVSAIFLSAQRSERESNPTQSMPAEKTTPKQVRVIADESVSVQDALSRAAKLAFQEKPPGIGDFEIAVKSSDERFSFLFTFESLNTNDLFITVNKKNGEIESMPVY